MSSSEVSASSGRALLESLREAPYFLKTIPPWVWGPNYANELQEDLYWYVVGLDEPRRIALDVAACFLETSFNPYRSNGFETWHREVRFVRSLPEGAADVPMDTGDAAPAPAPAEEATQAAFQWDPRTRAFDREAVANSAAFKAWCKKSK